MTSTQSEILDVLRGAHNLKAHWTGKALRCSGRFPGDDGRGRNVGFILTFENHESLESPRIKWTSPSRISRGIAQEAIGTIVLYTT